MNGSRPNEHLVVSCLLRGGLALLPLYASPARGLLVRAVAGSHFSNGDSIMLLDWRHGSIKFKVWKLEGAFKEQEGARGKACVGSDLAAR